MEAEVSISTDCDKGAGAAASGAGAGGASSFFLHPGRSMAVSNRQNAVFLQLKYLTYSSLQV
jgi:hypothetical protein